MAVIHTESRFKPDALSPKGAVGLMQIMPSTAAWAAEKCGLAAYTADKLTEPSVNIRIGAWYLKYLSGKFKEERLAVAAYNAGEGAVSNWLNLYGELADIPYKETREYVERVYKAKRFYGKRLPA